MGLSTAPHALRTWALRATFVVVLTALGAATGLGIGLATPAHTEIAGGTADIRVHLDQTYDQLDIGGVLTGKLSTNRSILGESVGVDVAVNPAAANFVTSDGKLDSKVLPAYIQTYNDPAELATELRGALVEHLTRFAAWGAGLALATAGVVAGLIAWRRRRDAHQPNAAHHRAIALAYRAPERRLARRALVSLVVLGVLASMPSAVHQPRRPIHLNPSPLLIGTPLEGAEIDGPLASAFTAISTYIQRYFSQTDDYYKVVKDNVDQAMARNDVTVPTGADLETFGYVTDRHCNTGMDRVILTMLQHYHAKVLVSGGDDDFSGSFPFESACTQNLARSTHRAGITDVFVGGNHDSAKTLADERKQKIKVLDGPPVVAGGLTFAGIPDPRTSRYGQGIVPSSIGAQTKLVTAQGMKIAELACTSKRPVIVVLHDPLAGLTALQNGCSTAILALDGHTHRQAGPTPEQLPDGSVAQHFVGASTGGAPVHGDADHNLTDTITVGPLNHDATINLVTVNEVTGQLVAITVCTITPDQQVQLSQPTVSTE